MRPHLDYGDVIFVKPYNNSFQQRLESLQYKVSFAITGAINGSSTKKVCQELGLAFLQNRQFFKNFASFTKLVKNSPQNIYLS